jgi:hypothetical protein
VRKVALAPAILLCRWLIAVAHDLCNYVPVSSALPEVGCWQSAHA